MNESLAIIGALALAVCLSQSALAGWDDGKGNPQCAPGGHGGQAFGVSERDHVSPNGHVDPSGTNGNQGSDNANPNANNANRGNAGGGRGEGGEP